MRTIDICGKSVEIYESIEDMPVARFHKYNKMLLVDAGIGSDLDDMDRHIEKAMRYARGNTPEMAVTELENLRQNVYFVQHGISPRLLSFAALVRSIDGSPCDDLSDEGLQRVADSFSHVPAGELAGILEGVKKKSRG